MADPLAAASGRTTTRLPVSKKDLAMHYGQLVERYLLGPELLRQSVSGMSDNQLNAAPVPFQRSTRQIVLHLSDMDLLFANHMKLMIARDEPTLVGVDKDKHLHRLMFGTRDVDEEVRFIKSVRRHMGPILRSIDADDYLRTGNHCQHGRLTLAQLLERAADHIPHHVHCIEEIRRALKMRDRAIPFNLASLGVMEGAIG
jgi:hypothetical protein